jgi:PIN domain nuclease of toxin-antitoxin system
MRLLLDTHVVLWWLQNDPHMPKAIRSVIASGEHDVAVSAISVWEITIKRMLGRLNVEIDELLMSFPEENFTEIPVRHAHSLRLLLLPRHHGDPFDRMLIAQSLHEGRRLVTTDSRILRYTDVQGFDPLTA